jgi:salicylate hydroxylase
MLTCGSAQLVLGPKLEAEKLMGATGLSVVIIGGGIGGLAAARALLRRGVDVGVYEQAAQITEVGAGVSISPNGVELLQRYGMGPAIEQVGARWMDAQFCRSDGTPLGSMLPPPPLRSSFHQFGIHRSDLIDLLAAALPPDVVRTGYRCTGVDQNAECATVSFSNGETVTADVVVAADGIHSVLREHGGESPAAVPSGSVGYRGLIPAASVSWPAGTVRVWVGPDRHFVTYPVRSGSLLTFLATVPTDAEMGESWSAPGEPAMLAQEFAGWDPLVESIIGQVDTTFRWRLHDREPLSKWTNGRLTLLGDAAHAMLPHVGQGANQAIEDGAALAAVLGAADRTTAAQALLTYESVRRDRTTRVQQISRSSLVRMRAASGSAGERREPPRAEEMSWLFGYDAEAEVYAAMGTHDALA